VISIQHFISTNSVSSSCFTSTVKIGVQKFVDRKFFRVEYDYREEQKRFLDDIKNIYYIQSLADLIVKRVDNLIPVEKLGYFELNNQNGRVRIIANKGWDLLSGRSIRFESENLKPICLFLLLLMIKLNQV